MTSQDRIKQLIGKIKGEDKKNEIDKGKIIKDWKGELEALYNDLESWLNPSENSIQTLKTDTTITEHLLGQYSVPALSVTIDDSTYLNFVPVGKHVIGARGRVDVISSKGKEATLILLAENEEPRIVITVTERKKRNPPEKLAEAAEKKLSWRIAQRESRGVKTLPLTSDSFADLLQSLL